MASLPSKLASKPSELLKVFLPRLLDVLIKLSVLRGLLTIPVIFYLPKEHSASEPNACFLLQCV